MPKKKEPIQEEAIVTADDQHFEQLEELTKRLKSSGAKVVSTLDFLGQITILCDPAKIPSLKQLEGVADVEVSRAVELPPPDSEVQ